MRALLARLRPLIAEPDHGSSGRSDRQFTSSVARLGVSTVVLLAAFAVAERALITICRLPDHTTTSSSLLGACAVARPAGVLFVAALYLVLLLTLPQLRQTWDRFEGGRSLRWFVTGIALALAWAGAGYAYNPWYDQPHTLDRLIVVALAAFVFVRPAFVPPFLFACSAVIWQFAAPRLGFSTLAAEFRPLMNTLAVFTAVLLVQTAVGRRQLTGFLFLTLCIVAANYWVPGYTKLRIGWMTHGHVYLLLPNAYTHGWLAFVDGDSIASVARILATVDWPIRLVTLGVECSSLLVFANARVARTLLVLFTALLGAFFGILGYFFWKWMLLQVALLVLLFRRDDSATRWRRELFTSARLTVSIVVIVGAARWFAPAPLAWFDTPLADTFRYEGIGQSGRVYDLAPQFFAPYESHIAMGAFVSELMPSAAVVGPYGVTTDRGTATALLQARTIADVERLERAALREEAERDRGAELDEFLRRAVHVSNRSIGATPGTPLARLRPPPFLWTFERGRVYDRGEPLVAVDVYRVSSLFDGVRYGVIRKERLRSIPIDP